VRAVQALGDHAGLGIEGEAPHCVRPRAVDDTSRHHAHDARGGIRARQRLLRRCRSPRELRGHGWPRRIRVDALEVDAVRTRAEPRFHERSDSHEPVAEDDRQVRNVAPQPLAMLRRGDREACDDHGGIHGLVLRMRRWHHVHPRPHQEVTQQWQ